MKMQWEPGGVWEKVTGQRGQYAPLLLYGSKARFPHKRLAGVTDAIVYGFRLIERANRLGVKWK